MNYNFTIRRAAGDSPPHSHNDGFEFAITVDRLNSIAVFKNACYNLFGCRFDSLHIKNTPTSGLS